jgi:putative two-component system response regulator
MVTGSGDATSAIQALTQGANAYLVKPVERNELLHHVERGLERRRLTFESRRYMQQLECRIREQTLVIRRAHEETIHRLVAASGYRDEETGGHVRRTGLFSEVLARAAGWSNAEAEAIRFAAPMHDVGKIGIPDDILRKPSRLTADEYEAMKRHTLIGAEILAESSSPLLMQAAEIALRHHERWDGAGYPHGLAGEAIPESARILAIVDVYDALTHDRVYRPALPVDQALEIMAKGRGTHFDPLLLPAFFAVHEEIERISHIIPDSSQAACSVTGSLPGATCGVPPRSEVRIIP